MKGTIGTLILILTLALLPESFAAEHKGSPTNSKNPDFNKDGRVDDNDLIPLAGRVGATVGEEGYGFLYDLSVDGKIDSEDIFAWLRDWKGNGASYAPIATEDFRAMTGLDDLVGSVWRFQCLPGGSEDCQGEGRTVTGGQLMEMGGRMVMPITWGSESGEPWDTLYLTMDGDLGFLGIEKVAQPNGFPGIVVPPQTIGIAGLIPWTTSETIYPGTVLESTGTASLQFSFAKGLEPLDIFCLFALGIFPSDEDLEDLLDAIFRIQLGGKGGTTILEKGVPTLEGPNHLVSGMGIMGVTDGVEATANWNLLFSSEGLVLIDLCWEFMGQKKRLSFGRIFDDPSDCLIEDTDFSNTFSGNVARIERGECIQGSLLSNEDPADWARVGGAGPGSSQVRIAGQTGEFEVLGIRIYRESPIESGLVDFGLISSQGNEFVVETPFGEELYLEIYQIDGFGEYEVSVVTVGK